MDEIIDDLRVVVRRCEAVARRFEEKRINALIKRHNKAVDSVGEAWSGGWMGYHSRVYTEGFKPKRPGEHFDTEWGDMDAYMSRSQGGWAEYPADVVRDAILQRARVSEDELEEVTKIAGEIVGTFEECKGELLPTLDAALRSSEDATLRDLRDKVEKVKPRISASDFAQHLMPRQHMTRDMRALQGGFQVPPHISMTCWMMSQKSTAEQVKELADHAAYAAKYLEKAMKMKGKSVAKKDGPIFIGHGGSGLWKDLRQFLVDRLKLQYEEFNREPTAGRSNKERLLEMLDRSPFAFLVMTAEDERKDGKWQARANVIHEAGLFQGRYGFERAIIMLEDGCEEFSNITGIGQIRFPKGDIEAKSEEIRRVLEREGIL